jgi:Mrp family chromosome partitioning ATPase/capsular polysaccharide biosynthesis protein
MMLDPQTRFLSHVPALDVEQIARHINFKFVLRSLGQHKRLIAASAAIVGLIGLCYVAARAPSYTARMQVLIENLQLNYREGQIFAEPHVDTAIIESQVEIIKSDTISLNVIKDLDLDAGQLLGRPKWKDVLVSSSEEYKPLSWLRNAWHQVSLKNILTLFGSEQAQLGYDQTQQSDRAQRDAVLSEFRDRLHVKRIGLSYVVEITFSAAKPELAAAITNKIGQTYSEFQTDIKIEAAQASSAWLRERMSSLGPSARVISEATPPASKSGPGGFIILVSSLISGTIIGAAAALARAISDHTIKDAHEGSRLLRIEYLGSVPQIGGRWSKATGRNLFKSARKRWLLGRVFSARALDPSEPWLRRMIRNIRVALEADKGGRKAQLIGVTSTIPAEGVTSVAIILGQALTHAGNKVLLVDANACKPDLSEMLASNEVADLPSVHGSATYVECIQQDRETGLHFLARAEQNGSCLGAGKIGASSIVEAIQDLCLPYDYIVFDLPPLMPALDARAATQLLDTILLVIEWGKVNPDDVREGLMLADCPVQKVLGFVLNKARSGPNKTLDA